jgi:hypothetical protein
MFVATENARDSMGLQLLADAVMLGFDVDSLPRQAMSRGDAAWGPACR